MAEWACRCGRERSRRRRGVGGLKSHCCPRCRLSEKYGACEDHNTFCEKLHVRVAERPAGFGLLPRGSRATFDVYGSQLRDPWEVGNDLTTLSIIQYITVKNAPTPELAQRWKGMFRRWNERGYRFGRGGTPHLVVFGERHFQDASLKLYQARGMYEIDCCQMDCLSLKARLTEEVNHVFSRSMRCSKKSQLQ